MANEQEILISRENLEDYHEELMKSFPKEQIWYGEMIPPDNVDSSYVLGVDYSGGNVYYRTSTGWKKISGGSTTSADKIQSKITITRVSNKNVYTSFDDTECDISFKWTCYVNNKNVKTNGEITILVNGAIKETFTASTGTITKNIRDYLNPGSNSVIIKIKDGYNSEESIDFTATLVSMVVSVAGYSTNQVIFLDELLKDSENETEIGFKVNVTVTGGVEKELHLIMDGIEYDWNQRETPKFKSGPDTQTITIPLPKSENSDINSLEGVHGSHRIELYAVAYKIPGKPRSNSILYDTIWWDNVTPKTETIIASSFFQTEGRQYEMLKIPYYLYRGAYSDCWVRFGKKTVEEVDGERKESEIVYLDEGPQKRANRTAYEWTVNSDIIGENIFVIQAGDYNEETKEFDLETTKEFSIFLKEQEVPNRTLEGDGVLLFELKAEQSNNDNENKRAIWSSTGEKKFNVIFPETFDWNTSGWEMRDNRPALKISNGDQIEIPYAIFAQPQGSMENFSEYGETISIDVSFSDVIDPESEFLICFDEGTKEKPVNRGLKISPRRAMLTNSQHTVQTEYQNSESKKYTNTLRFDFVINKLVERKNPDGTYKDKLGSMFLYINGIGASASEYYENENFAHGKNLFIKANGCTVHLHSLRVFRGALESTKILNNWIYDMTIENQINADYANKIYDEDGNIVYTQVLERIPCMRIVGETLPSSKGDKQENIDIYFEGTKDGLYDFKIFGVQLDVQGTSSQYYPVKNWKFKSSYKNSNGEKVTRLFETTQGSLKKYALADDQLPASVFCLKADYMETSSTHNTVTANFANTMYDSNQKTPPQSPRKNKQGIETEAEKERASKTRTTIYGRPIIVFYQDNLESDLIFGGKYNFNYDKDAADVFGFLEEDEEYESYEVIDCIEFRENRNDRCLLKVSDYTNEYKDGLTAVEQDEYDEKSLEDLGNGVVRGYEWGRSFEFRNYYHRDETEESKPYEYLKPVTDWIVSTNYAEATNKKLSEMGLQDYVVEKGVATFSYDNDLNIIRFEDYNRNSRRSLDLGYLEPEDFDYTIETHFQIQTYVVENEGQDNEQLKESEIIRFEEKKVYISKHGLEEWNKLLNTQASKTRKPQIYYALAWQKNQDGTGKEVYQFEKDSQNYRLTKFKNELSEHFNEHYCLMYFLLMEMLGMIDSSTKNMFWATWGERHKNHPIESGDKVVIWYPIFYDMDTMMGINNVGEMTIPYNVEFDSFELVWDEEDEKWVESYFFNGYDNVFWNNFRKAYVNELNETFRKKVSEGTFSLNNILKTYEEHSNSFPDAIYNEDGDLKIIKKYFDGFYEASAKEMETWDEDDFNNNIKYPDWMHVYQGDRYYYRRFWLPNRFNYLLSKNFAGTYAKDLISMRLWDPGIEYDDERKLDYGFDITTWTDQYTKIKYGGRSVIQRCSAYEPVRIEAPGTSYNDTETAIYGASNLRTIGNLSTKYASNLELSAAKNLLELDIGNSHPSYNNTNLKSVSFGSNSKLRRVNVQNCKSLREPLGLAGCPNIIEIDARGTIIPGVQLPERGVLRTLLLPSTITSLVLKNQTKLENFLLPTTQGKNDKGEDIEYYNLQQLEIINTPNTVINTKELVEKSIDRGLEKLYLTGINWSEENELDDLTLLFKIKEKYERSDDSLKGGTPGDSSTILNGVVHVAKGEDYLIEKLIRFFNGVKDTEELPSEGSRKFNIKCRDTQTTYEVKFITIDENGVEQELDSGMNENRVVEGKYASFTKDLPIKKAKWDREYQFLGWRKKEDEVPTLYSSEVIEYANGQIKPSTLFSKMNIFSNMTFYAVYLEKPVEFNYTFTQNDKVTVSSMIITTFDSAEFFDENGKIITKDYLQESITPEIPDDESGSDVTNRYTYWISSDGTHQIDEETSFTVSEETRTQLNYMPGQSTPDTKHRFIFKGWDSEKGVEKTLRGETILYNGDSIWDIVPEIEGTDKEFKTTEKVYTFKGWTLLEDWENIPEENIENIPEFVNEEQGKPKTYIYRAAYSSIARPYTITFKNHTGKIIYENEFPYGTKPTYGGTEEDKQREGHTWTGWELENSDTKEIVEVTGEATYITTHNINTYTITYRGYQSFKEDDDNSRVERTKQVVYNVKIPEIEPIERVGYKFKGWKIIAPSDLTELPTNMPADRIELEAIYEIINYNITFKGYTSFDESNPVSKNWTLHYDDPITLPNETEFYRTGYDFKGWQEEIPERMPAADQEFNANYEKIEYIIKFVDYDDTPIKTTTQYYNSPITKPKNPSRTGYTFKHWTIDGQNKVTVDSKVTQSRTYKAYYAINQYTLTFSGYQYFDKNASGSKVERKITQNYGTTIQQPAAIERVGYNFVGWDKAIPSTMPAENQTINAVYDIIKCTVTFEFNNGEENSVKEYNYNDPIIKPNEPTKRGYNFIGWDKTIQDKVTSDIAYVAQYEAKTYDITFIAYTDFHGFDQKSITQSFAYDEIITPPEELVREGYDTIWPELETWNILGNRPDENLTIYAKQDIIVCKYLFKYKTYEGEDIDNQDNCQFNYRTQIVIPTEIEMKGYSFDGWLIEGTNTIVQSEDIDKTAKIREITYIAQYSVLQFNVHFLNEDGDEENPYFTTLVNYGEKPVYNTIPIKTADSTYIYEFRGWVHLNSGEYLEYTPNSEFVFFEVNEEEAQFYRAVFEPVYIEYYVTFKWIPGGLQTNAENYEVAGWSESISFHYGQTIVPPEHMVATGYTFDGWSDKPSTRNNKASKITFGQITDEDIDYVYYATWDPNPHTVTFIYTLGNDSTEWAATSSTTTVMNCRYGDYITAPQYSENIQNSLNVTTQFDCWKRKVNGTIAGTGIEQVQRNVVYEAVYYESQLRYYDVKWKIKISDSKIINLNNTSVGYNQTITPSTQYAYATDVGDNKVFMEFNLGSDTICKGPNHEFYATLKTKKTVSYTFNWDTAGVTDNGERLNIGYDTANHNYATGDALYITTKQYWTNCDRKFQIDTTQVNELKEKAIIYQVEASFNSSNLNWLADEYIYISSKSGSYNSGGGASARPNKGKLTYTLQTANQGNLANSNGIQWFWFGYYNFSSGEIHKQTITDIKFNITFLV